jgi:hypothetical protein
MDLIKGFVGVGVAIGIGIELLKTDSDTDSDPDPDFCMDALSPDGSNLRSEFSIWTKFFAQLASQPVSYIAASRLQASREGFHLNSDAWQFEI